MNRQGESLEGAAFNQKITNLVKHGGQAIGIPCKLMSDLMNYDKVACIEVEAKGS